VKQLQIANEEYMGSLQSAGRDRWQKEDGNALRDFGQVGRWAGVAQREKSAGSQRSWFRTWVSCMVFGDAGDYQSQGGEGNSADGDEHESESRSPGLSHGKPRERRAIR